ncbi:sensor histidine kinase [Simplicispira metamorpha]|uniref:Histidine kinase domain-containing protein n=1 Tax=Simplicispira metamorpha TaxID=80881 RepID=A0A4R2MW06_9BURK|nr:7TM diverse intracellular signaling domain-containing protein [Simplicispira metamorpha]TCP11081.1 hypothetical protein EV674_1497 [Simplicispira metamorpha]
MEAAPSGWLDERPPASGWRPVQVPSNWNAHWPGHDGVVWYRLRWNIAGAPQTLGLYMHYVMSAGAISVNGVELDRDESLVEPLSRAWNRPRFLLLPAPLLHAGRNELLIRVSGYAAYQPALGKVEIGPPGPLRAAQRASELARKDLNWLHLGIGATLGCFFLALWLMRRQEAAYGWYAARQAAWVGFTVNFVNTSTWPLAHTHAYAAATTAAYVLYHGCGAMFVLRFMGRRWPRREAVLWLLICVACAAVLLAPHEHMKTVRHTLAWASSALVVATALVFLHLAWRGGSLAQRLLSAAMAANALAMVHDLLVFSALIHGNFYLASYTAWPTTIGMALTLAWTFVANTRRIERFNDEMHHSVAAARAELKASLARQHALELLHARLGERVNLAHDLHDGLGGMLIGNINTLERTRAPLPPQQVLDMMRTMRDDLRLIIDTASAQHHGELSLADLLAPLRYRMSQLFELHGIEAHWRVSSLDKVQLDATQSLDVLRVLQEALTNVFKHSRATRVDVTLVREEGGHLRLEVHDNGVGLESSAAGAPPPPGGTGLRSMQTRAQRLGARLAVDSRGSSTTVALHMPLQGLRGSS